MPEDNKGSDAGVDDTQSNVKETPKETPGDTSSDQINNLNAALRSERSAIKDLKKELDTARNSHLEDQGKYRELYEAQKTSFDSMKTRVDGYESFITDSVETAKKTLPENALKLFPSHAEPQEQLAWITDASEVFKTENSPTKPRPDQRTRGQVNTPASDNRVTVSKEEFENMTLSERSKVIDQFVTKDPITGMIMRDKN